MRVGVHIVAFSLPGGPASIGPTLAAVGPAAEDAGIDNLSVMDHYFQLPGFGLDAGRADAGGLHDARLPRGAHQHGGAAAAGHRRDVPPPGLLAKIVTTLDVLSGGRAVLGIGAAWYEREHRALGVPFPPVAERFERLEEALQIVHQMWSDDDGPYDGMHYQLAETLCSPRAAAAAAPADHDRRRR